MTGEVRHNPPHSGGNGTERGARGLLPVLIRIGGKQERTN